MAKKIKFDINHQIEPFTIILATRELTLIGKIHNVEEKSVHYSANLNSANELSFTVHKELDGYVDPLWDDITNLMLVYIKDINEYFEIQVDKNHSDDLHKEITCKSLCEAELGQTMLYEIEINTEDDIARDDYVEATVFWNPQNPSASLMHRILEKTPHYSVSHVDSSIANLQRTFSINNTSVYDFLTGDCAKQFNCLFQFDSTNRTIQIYDLYTVCLNDECSYYIENHKRYRGVFNDVCPKCGSRHLSWFGEDTNVFVDRNNLTDDIKFDTDVDSIKNTFRLEAGDDLMTSTIINNNPNGTQYITYFSDEMKALMPADLVEKLEDYDELYDSYQDEYTTVANNIYNQKDQISYLKHKMMPSHTTVDTNAEQELAKLTSAALSPISLQSITTSTSKANVDNAIKNYAKVLIRAGYYKVEIKESSYTPGTTTWAGKFTVTSYANKDDTATNESNVIVTLNTNYENFLTQKIAKQLIQDQIREEDEDIYNVVTISNLSVFTTTIQQYCLKSLESFKDAIVSALEILQQMGHGKHDDTGVETIYEDMYVPLQNKKYACKNEINIRQSSIDSEETLLKTYEDRRDEIKDILNFRNYLGETLYLSYCAYRRENTYSNTNYISDGLDNDEIFANAREFIDSAEKEIIKAGTPQHTITANIYNLLAIPEFSLITDNFDIGNWIRIRVENSVYRLRLIGYQINFNDLTRINTTFSDVTQTADGFNDVLSILNSAKSMATSYATTSLQASKGKEADANITEFRQVGLDSALYRIKNSNTEEITVDNHGLTARDYDDISDTYGDEQVKVTHNMIVFTTNNWQSVEMAIGKQDYMLDGNKETVFGVNANTVIAGKVISGDIYSGNYSSDSQSPQGTHINLTTGDFTFAGGKLTYNTTQNKLTLKGEIETTSGKIGGFNITNSSLYNGKSSLTANANGVYIGTDGISLGTNSTFKVDSSGNLTAYSTTITGTLTANSGSKIGPWNVTNSSIYNNKSSLNDNHDGVYIGTDGIALGVRRSGAFMLGSKFKVDSSGNLTASDVDLTGTINATGGTFSGNITATGTINGATLTGSSIMTSEDNSGYQIKLINNSLQFIKDNSVLGTLYGAYNSILGRNTIACDSGFWFKNDILFSKSIGVANDTHPYIDFHENGSILGDYTCRIQANGNHEFNFINGAGNFTTIHAAAYDCTSHILVSRNETTGTYGKIEYDASSGNFNMANESGFANVAGASWVNASSKMVKDNIKKITTEDAKKILHLNPVTFDYKWGVHSQGMIAEEVYDVYPQLVHMPKDWNENDFEYENGKLQNVPSLDYSSFIPYMIKMIQIQQEEIENLKQQIN